MSGVARIAIRLERTHNQVVLAIRYFYHDIAFRVPPCTIPGEGEEAGAGGVARQVGIEICQIDLTVDKLAVGFVDFHVELGNLMLEVDQDPRHILALHGVDPVFPVRPQVHRSHPGS